MRWFPPDSVPECWTRWSFGLPAFCKVVDADQVCAKTFTPRWHWRSGGVELRLAEGAGNGDETVADASKSPGVAMPFGTAYLALQSGGHDGPVIDGILQALVYGETAFALLPERRVTGATPHRHLKA